MNIPSQSTVICAENSLNLSHTALAIMIGMLIKNEKSNTSSLFAPASRPVTSVVPLLEIPGRSANPCANPI